MVNIDTIHNRIRICAIFKVEVIQETSVDSGVFVNLSFNIDTDTAIPRSAVVAFILITHTSVAGPVNVANLLFQIGNANAEVCEFVSIFAGEFVNGRLLLCIQLVFFCHEASYDLSQFVTGHVSFAFEGAVRITFYDALSRQVGYCLIRPVISGDIGEWICSVSGYAGGECCYSSQCEDLFHNKSLLKKT
ncbi:Uncharacterised protein [Bacteroides xylanisolvens]|nr:Uncharacterised protein [Bacteroides xylanisolvens]